MLVNCLTRIGKKWIACVDPDGIFNTVLKMYILLWGENTRKVFFLNEELHIARWTPRAMAVESGMSRTGSAVHNRVVVRIYR